MPNSMANSIVEVFFYRPQSNTTDLISKMHEKSLALTVFSKLCQCRGLPNLPKTSLTHETKRQTDAGGATISSYIMNQVRYPKSTLEKSPSEAFRAQFGGERGLYVEPLPACRKLAILRSAINRVQYC